MIRDTVHGTEITVPKGSPGVVGQTPRLPPGHHFEYVSGAELGSSDGVISGSYEFADDDGIVFDASLSPFALKQHHLHSVNFDASSSSASSSPARYPVTPEKSSDDDDSS